MSSIGERVKAARTALGWGAPRLAKAIGVSTTTIQDLEKGDSVGTKHILAIARALKQKPEWIESGAGSMFRPHARALDARPPRYSSDAGADLQWDAAASAASAPSIEQVKGVEYARLPLYDIRAQAGKGSLAQDGDPVGWRLFDLNWIKTISRAPLEQLKVVEISGDSMEPTLFKGDHVLVDLANQSLAQHGLFVLRMDESLMVKRIQKKFRTGTVRVISDNPRYEVEEISEPEKLHVVGRVMWIGRSVG